MIALEKFGYEIALTIIYLSNFLAILNLLFKKRRNTETTVAWILVLIIAPMIGFILYISFGRGIAKDNMFKIKEVEDKMLKVGIFKTKSILDCDFKQNPLLLEYKDMIYSLANSNNSILTTNNDVFIYQDSSEFFDELLKELDNAKEYIHILFYIFKDDELGTKVINKLIEKSKEGVEIRFLYDAVGSRSLKSKTIQKLKDNNIKVDAFFPSFMKIFNINVNYRNHRKIVVIDGKTGFLGGNNVGDEYVGKDPKFGYWRDTHLKLVGDCVRDLNIRFLLDWRYTNKEDFDFKKYFSYKDIKTTTNTGVQIVSSGPESVELDEIKFGYIKMIQSAKKYIYIQSPYFILDKTLTETLKIACFSGVDVRIMIPEKPDHPFVYWASSSYAGELLKYGAKLYNYDYNSFLHAKTIVVDDKICSIGTANMDIRSFELNFEINAFIYSKDLSKKQRLIFEEDMKKSKEITVDVYNSRSQKVKIKESISRLLSPIL